MDNKPAHALYRLKMPTSGRIVIPIELRRDAGIHPHDELIAYQDGASIRIVSADAALQSFQDYCRGLAPADQSLADELVADRRREADRDRNE